MRQTIKEARVAGEMIQMDRIEIADRAGRVLAVVKFNGDVGPASDEPTPQ